MNAKILDTHGTSAKAALGTLMKLTPRRPMEEERLVSKCKFFGNDFDDFRCNTVHHYQHLKQILLVGICRLRFVEMSKNSLRVQFVDKYVDTCIF